MKLDLERYVQELNYLVERKDISQNTARTYVSCLNVIKQEFNELTPESLKSFLMNRLNNRKQFLKYVSAIRKYEQLVLKQDKGILFGEPEIELFMHFRKENTSKGKELSISESKALRKINALRNKKLKYALRLQLKSGLRVSEVSELEKEDIKFIDGKIKIYVRHGKGDKARKVNVIEDDYLYKNLSDYINECKSKKLFYSSEYLRHKAAEYGMETHDLRRLNARRRLKTEIKKGKTRKEAKKIVQKELGHESTRITDLYIQERRQKVE